MTQSAINAAAFITEVSESQSVWAIRDKAGFPTSTNASGETAMPFWSSQERAQRIIETAPAYRAFQPVKLGLDEFRERWLPGLERDGLLVGMNWSGERVTGYDITPSDVLARLRSASG